MNKLCKHFDSMDEYIEFRQNLEEKVYNYWQLKDPNGGHVSAFGWDNCGKLDYEKRCFCVAYTTTFDGMIKDQYLRAFITFPEKYNTGEAMDIIESLYKTNGFSSTNMSLDEYLNFLLEDVNCFVNLKFNGVLDEELLKIELFHELRPNEKDDTRKSFSGGLFQLLKYFSFRDKNLSTECDEGISVSSLREIVALCIMAFADKQMMDGNEEMAFAYQQVSKEKRIKYMYRKEKGLNVFYIESVSLEDAE